MDAAGAYSLVSVAERRGATIQRRVLMRGYAWRDQADYRGMGRQSREKARRRSDPRYRARVNVAQAEARGRRVPSTMSGFEEVARARGSEGVVEALIARHNQRWNNVRKNIELLSDHVVQTLHVVFPMDVFLWKSGVRFTEPPPSPYGGWEEHLRWAIDSACQSVRMALACNPLGAASISRTQLERWSANRSTSSGREQPEGMPTDRHYTAIWGPENPLVPAGLVWNQLSEVLHGRGELVDVARWDSGQLANSAAIVSGERLATVALTAVQLSLRQVMLCIATLAEEADYPRPYVRTLRSFPIALPSEVAVRNAPLAVWPLNFQTVEQFGSRMVKEGKAYLSDVEKLASGTPARNFNYSQRSFEAFISRRSRAADWAMIAFDMERRDLGADFDPSGLAARESAYIIINETAALLSLWTQDYIADALAVSSCALRAAYWLWLEDDDRAMAVARTVIEQAARLRTWRLKADKAALIESRGARASSRDWLEAAGWRRLSILNRSLGEFSHATRKARWSGARDALIELQPLDPGEQSPREQTARGNALNEVAFALGSELAHLARNHHKALAEAFESVLPFVEENGSEAQIERWLQRCWSHSGMSFGTSDFRHPHDWLRPASRP